MPTKLLELDLDQLFIWDNVLFRVIEIIVDSSDIITAIQAQVVGVRTRGSTTPPSMFYCLGGPRIFKPETYITLIGTDT